MPATDLATEVRAVRAGDARILTPVEVKLAPPGPGEVRVEIEAAGVAYADIVMRRGVYSGVKPPVTPGYDFVGRILALGPGVPNFVVGDRVAGITVTGSYATHRNVPARLLVRAPEAVEAAKLVAVALNGVTAWQMLHHIAPQEPGAWVLIHGAAGGVGSLLLDLARLAGLNVIGTASAAKLPVIAARGGEAIDHARDDVVKRAIALSGGGVHVVFDPVGGSHFRRRSLPALRATGTGVLYGGYNATRSGRINLLAIADLMLGGWFSAFRLFGRSQSVATYAFPEWQRERAESCRRDLSAMLHLVAEKKLDPLIGARLPLSDAAEANRLLEARAVAGKIVLVP